MTKLEKIKVGVIGLGCRGYGLLETVLVPMCEQNILEIVSVCDSYEDRTLVSADFVEQKINKRPKCTTDWNEVVCDEDVNAVLVLTSWEDHVKICIASMEAGKPVGVEVGGAYKLQDCFDLVACYERTGVHCMMLENCCYGRRELMALNMSRKGLFGSVVHCSGGYMHDLREEIINGDINRHYRQRNYLTRNCENYPTHELGPIMSVLDINNGNRFVSLVSVASCAKGLNEFAKAHRGEDHFLSTCKFAQGDIVTTLITCAGGEIIRLTLDTTLIRPYYSREFTVRGTKGMCEETMHGHYTYILEGMEEGVYNNKEEFYAKYDHPLHKEYAEMQAVGDHGGIDWLVLRAFVESVKSGTNTPIDAYDTASWLAIGPLSEMSIANGNTAVAIPDFTNGRWFRREEPNTGKYSLDVVITDNKTPIKP